MNDHELRALFLALVTLIECLFPFMLVVLALLLIGSMALGHDLIEPISLTTFSLAGVFFLRWLRRRYLL